MILNYTKNKGFTLIEVSIVIFIMGLIGVSLGAMQRDIFSLNRNLGSALDIQRETRQALQSMSKEIRSASQSNIGAYAIDAANGTSLIFYSDSDADGLKERIRYFLNGETFKKGVIEPSGNPLVYDSDDEVVIDVIHNIANGGQNIFDYYDANYDGGSSPLSLPVDIIKIRLVKISIVIQNNLSDPPALMTLTTQVSLRNLKDNL